MELKALDINNIPMFTTGDIKEMEKYILSISGLNNVRDTVQPEATIFDRIVADPNTTEEFKSIKALSSTLGISVWMATQHTCVVETDTNTLNDMRKSITKKV